MREIVIDIRGPNGTGKTTILQLMHKVLEDYGFEVKVTGEDLEEMIYQQNRLTPEEIDQRHDAVRKRTEVTILTTPTSRPFQRR